MKSKDLEQRAELQEGENWVTLLRDRAVRGELRTQVALDYCALGFVTARTYGLVQKARESVGKRKHLAFYEAVKRYGKSLSNLSNRYK